MDLPGSAPSDEPGLMASLRQFSSDLIDYGEARLRLIQAEVKGYFGRYQAVGRLAGIAALCGCFGYLPLLLLQVLYLAKTWFDGTYMAPLLIVSALHFVLALVFAFLAWKRWKVNQEIFQEEAKEPILPEPRIMS